MGKFLQYGLDQMFKNFTTKIILLVFGFLVVVSLAFIFLSYRSHINAGVEREFVRLQGATRPLAVQINAELHERIRTNYADAEALEAAGEGSGFPELQRQLREVKDALGLDSEIYTVVKDEQDHRLEFIATSSQIPYYKHVWKKPNPEVLTKFEQGALIGPYTDENGTWLSSFEPIKMKGRTIGIVQADKRFDAFMQEARSSFLHELLMFLCVLVVSIFVLIRLVNRILRQEEKFRLKLLKTSELIAEKNKSITDSLRVADRIQQSVLPNLETIRTDLPTLNVLYQPKDTVSGDFYWYEKVGSKVYIAVGDCTGHGVPGAMMSMMASSALYYVLKNNDGNVAEMLNGLDEITRRNWHQDDERSAGMDIVLCCLDLDTLGFTFASAMRPLLFLRNGELMKVDGERTGIGASGNSILYTEQRFDVLPGDTVYLFSDGYMDQFGGSAGKRYKTKQFNHFLTLIQDHPMEEQFMLLRYEFHLWKQAEEQVDDVLVLGFRVPGYVLGKTA